MSEMTPREIVQELDKYIIGQSEAKRAVAIALRNRWRRGQVPPPLHQEITPKNILMIGPTGVGKTEIARRLAQLANAPFIKVEATKFTEVGYVGKDVESIIRDLTETAVDMIRSERQVALRQRAEELAEERILDILIPGPRDSSVPRSDEGTRQKFRKMLREGKLDAQEIEIEVSAPKGGVEIMAPAGMEEMTNQLREMFSNMAPGKTSTRRVAVSEAQRLLTDDEAAKLVIANGQAPVSLWAKGHWRREIEERISAGVQVDFCENSLRNMGLNPDDRPAGSQLVAAGIIAIADAQEAGALYIKP